MKKLFLIGCILAVLVSCEKEALTEEEKENQTEQINDSKDTLNTSIEEINDTTNLSDSISVNDTTDLNDSINVIIENNYLDYIIAGKSEGVGIKHVEINKSVQFEYSFTEEEIDIDFNGDGVNDFKLNYYASASPGHSYTKMSFSAIGDKSFVAVSNLEDNSIHKMSLNDTIDNKLIWTQEEAIIYQNSWIAGKRINTEDEKNYVGVKIIVDDQEIFGWINIENSTWEVFVYDGAHTISYEVNNNTN